MNVTINRAEMLCAIKRASAIAPADSPLDVLRGVLLEADAAAGKLTVTSTNLEAALEEKLPCTVQEDGALVFGAKMLAEMLSRLPQDTVQLCRAENQGRMTLRSGDACYEVDVWERGAFPKPDLPFPEDTVKLSGIPAMAQHTVFATAQDNSKPLLKCVNLMFTSTGLRAAGSNGNCIVTARGDNQSTGDVSLLIPAASLGKLSNMCQDKDEFRVGTTGKSIVFFRENFLFSARLMEGGYIDTDQLVGSIRNAFTVLTDIHDMRAALSSVLSIGTGNRVKLSFQDQRLVFQCAGDCVSASAPIEVIALTGAPAGDYWFNAKQLVTCLKALSGTVTLGIAQGGMLTLATQDAYYLQSAMRPEAQKKTQKAAQPAAAKAAYPIPVISFFAASNEIPNFNDPQEKILEALYDRLELKVVTANMEDRDTRLAVLKNKQTGAFGQISATITLEELRQMQQEVASIPVPDAINELADDILCELRKDMAVSDRKYLGYYPIAQAKAWLSGHDKVESCDLLALKNYLWRLPSDREKVEAVLTRLCVNPMQDKVNNIRGMALESQEEFDAALGDGSKADTARKAFIKLRGELTHLYQMQCSLRTAAQSDSEIALVDDLLADLEKISRKAHEQTHFTYTTLEEIAALN